MSSKKERAERDGYYLVPPRPGRTSFYLIAWVELDKHGEQQRRTRSTRQSDYGEAYATLVRYAQKHPLAAGAPATRADARQVLREGQIKMQPLLDELGQMAQVATVEDHRTVAPQDDMLLKHVMVLYKAARPDLKNANRVADTLADAIEVWGDTKTVKTMDLPAQQLFVTNRRALLNADGTRRQTDWTINTRLNCVWAAIRHAVAVAGVLSPDARQERLAPSDWAPRADLQARRSDMEFEQVVAFVAASFARVRWLRWTLLELMSPRPGAAFDMQPQNVDLKHRLLSLRAILPDGSLAPASDKRRPTIRFGEIQARWFAFWNEERKPAWHDPNYVTFNGRRMSSMKFVHDIAARAGITIPKNVGAYFLRKYICNYLAQNGCDPHQIQLLMGHKVYKGSTAAYIHFTPKFLREVVVLLEQLLIDIDAALPEGLTILTPHNHEVDVRVNTETGAVVLGEVTDQELEALDEQPEPLRYAADFWEQFRQYAAQWREGSPVRMRPNAPSALARANSAATRRNAFTEVERAENARDRGYSVATDSENDTGNSDLESMGGSLTRTPDV